MAKGYNLDKAKAKQQNRENMTIQNNSTANILEGFIKKSDDKSAQYILLHELYAAPSEWNFFNKLNDSQTYELIESIEKEGLMNPILVWKKDRDSIEQLSEKADQYLLEGNKYMILAGHNRVNAFRLLFQQTGDEKYSKIPAFIYDGMDEERAKYIIVASNYIQRALSKEERRQSISYMYRTLNQSKDKSINVAKTIAEQTNMSPRSVFDEMSITDKLIPYFILQYDQCQLSKVNALRLTKVPKDIQQYMVEMYSDKIDNDALKQIKGSIETTSEADEIFADKELLENMEQVEVVVNIPKELEKKFKEMARKWLNRQLKRSSTEN